MQLKQSPIAILALTAVLGLFACTRTPSTPQGDAAKAGSEADYQAPPRVTSVRVVAGHTEVFGAAAPQASIRLARPSGPAGQTLADRNGRWVISLPTPATVELFGVSQSAGGRVLQASGYLLVTADGRGAVLRSGAGALVLAGPDPARVTALDIDRQGGAVVSGFGPAGTRVSARIDGDKLGEGKIDGEGRFVLALTGPVAPGRHNLKIFGEATDLDLRIDAGRAEPLTAAPFRATPVGSDLRIDWMTPGGGEQTTWLYGQGASAK